MKVSSLTANGAEEEDRAGCFRIVVALVAAALEPALLLDVPREAPLLEGLGDLAHATRSDEPSRPPIAARVCRKARRFVRNRSMIRVPLFRLSPHCSPRSMSIFFRRCRSNERRLGGEWIVELPLPQRQLFQQVLEALLLLWMLG